MISLFAKNKPSASNVLATKKKKNLNQQTTMKTKPLPVHQFMLPHTAAAWASVVQGPGWMVPTPPFLFAQGLNYILANERQPTALNTGRKI